jgi:hypothetical protein
VSERREIFGQLHHTSSIAAENLHSVTLRLTRCVPYRSVSHSTVASSTTSTLVAPCRFCQPHSHRDSSSCPPYNAALAGGTSGHLAGTSSSAPAKDP